MGDNLPRDPGSWNTAAVRGTVDERMVVDAQIERLVGLPPHRDLIPDHFIRDGVLEPSLCLLYDINCPLDDKSRKMLILRCSCPPRGYDQVSTDGAYTPGYRASYAAVARKFPKVEGSEVGQCPVEGSELEEVSELGDVNKVGELTGYRLGWTLDLIPCSCYHELVGVYHGLELAIILEIKRFELVVDNEAAAQLIRNLLQPAVAIKVIPENEEDATTAAAKRLILERIEFLILRHWVDQDGGVRICVRNVYRQQNFLADNLSHSVSLFVHPDDYTPLTRIFLDPGFHFDSNEYFRFRDGLSYYIRYFGNFLFLAKKDAHFSDMMPGYEGGGEGRGPEAKKAEDEKMKKALEEYEKEKVREKQRKILDTMKTLDEYEKAHEEKRKVLDAMKAEERKVEIDKEFESMKLLKREHEEIFVKLGSDKKPGKRREDGNREEKVRKSVMELLSLKPAEGEISNNRFGGGRRNRGEGDRGATRGSDGAIKREVGVVGVRKQPTANTPKNPTITPSNSSLGKDVTMSSGSIETSTALNKTDQVSQPTVSSGTFSSRSFSSSGKAHQPVAGHQKAPQANKAWTQKTSEKSNAANPGVIGKTSTFVARSPKNSTGLTKEAVVQEKLPEVNIFENQHVIIPEHL